MKQKPRLSKGQETVITVIVWSLLGLIVMGVIGLVAGIILLAKWLLT
jgi:hypothetical protein